MQIIKRDGSLQEYSNSKIKSAIKKAFNSQEKIISDSVLNDIIFSIENAIEYSLSNDEAITVEWIQDHVEIELMRREYYKEVRAYILYREEHKKTRFAINRIIELAKNKRLSTVLKKIQKEFEEDIYDLSILQNKFETVVNEETDRKEALDKLILTATQLISKETPKYEYIAGRLLNFKINENVDDYFNNHNVLSFYEKIKYYVDNGYYGSFLLENYLETEVDELESYIDYSRDSLLKYSGIDLLGEKYLIHNNDIVIEKIQDMFMAIAMHLAMKEENKIWWVKEYYDVLSSLKLTIASPTLFNSRKPIRQLSSSFVNVVPDDLQGIYKSLDSFAEVTKYGGGMGIYFGKVRASGSEIKGINGSAAGVCKWTKLVNDTVLAVEYYGNRKGACSVYLDAWHKDLIDFLSVHYGGDDLKSPDIFPAICYPDLFWKMVKNNINGTWYLMCPDEIREIKGFSLEDYYGQEWENRYWDCIKDERLSKNEVPIKDILKLIFKSILQTGYPLAFNRDIVNKDNPNKHMGIIYCSSLYGDSAQNTMTIDNNEIIVEDNHLISSNLASINLGKINVNDNQELKHVIDVAVRLLDNSIDINNHSRNQLIYNYRSIGLGVLGYHNCLIKNNIKYESEQHLSFADKLFERINLFAINASCTLAKERGAYKYFEGSDWQTGEYFLRRGYLDSSWIKMRAKVERYGLRNGYLLAISPTTSSSIIAGTTKGIDPIQNKLSIEIINDLTIYKVAPDLDNKTFWLYKNAVDIDQEWIIDACTIRQRHIDQSQSMSLFIGKDLNNKQLLSLFIHAWNNGIKTILFKLI